jgi:ubiquinone/menaquinone biosynthesis C-methylase UbiE
MDMETTQALKAVQDVYSGPEGDLWKLVMGEQIHIGGLTSSRNLCEKAGIYGKEKGVDLCCCLGAGMRFILRFCNVAHMTGVDATAQVLKAGKAMFAEEGVLDKISLVLAEVTATGLPEASADFVWGEDAWCYVENKPGLIAEAARIVKSGGIIAFTDWVEGPAGMSEEERTRFYTFMKFPNVQTIPGYKKLLEENHCTVTVAEDTGEFARHVDLYLGMLSMQLTYDALKIIGFNETLFGQMAGEMVFMQGLAHAGKIAQGRFVATKN